MKIKPCTLREANAFVREKHRHSKQVRGCKFCIGALVDNKLVGVIFAGYRKIENVGLSSPLVALKVFLKKAIARGEMQLWETNNTPKINTQVDRIWIQQMQHKLDEVFGN